MLADTGSSTISTKFPAKGNFLAPNLHASSQAIEAGLKPEKLSVSMTVHFGASLFVGDPEIPSWL
jgi:hypothetical protein